MKKILVSLLSLLLLATGCQDDDELPQLRSEIEIDEVFVFHPNPGTGVAFTPVELDSIDFNPREVMEFTDGQSISMALVTSSQPTRVELLNVNSDTLETYTGLSSFGENQFITPNFTSSLAAVNLNDPGDITVFRYRAYFNSPEGVIQYTRAYSLRRVLPPPPPGAEIDFQSFLFSSTDGATGLQTIENLSDRVDNFDVGTEMVLDGASSQVEIVEVPGLTFRRNGDFSVGLWVKTTSGDSDPSIIGDKDWGSGSNPGFVMAYIGSNWKLNAGDGTNRVDINGNDINDGDWHFIMSTFDRDGDATIYQDGVAVGSTSMAGIGEMNSGFPMRIGQDGTGAYSKFFNGSVGEVYLYDRALTADEAAMAARKKTGMQSRSSTGDIFNIPLTLDPTVTTTVEEGRNVLTFDGSNQAVANDGGELDFRFTGDYSIALWVNTTSSNSDPSIIADKDWGSGGNPGFILSQIGSNWKLNAGNGGARIDANGNDINDGVWHLIGATFDRDGSATIFQDGITLGSVDMTALTDMTVANSIRLAQDGTGAYSLWYEGKIANTMIFDYVLSEDEILSLFQQ